MNSMNNKLRLHPSSLQNSLQAWDEKADKLAQSHPLKTLSHLPKIVGITPSTSRFLKGKSLWYLLRYDTGRVFLRYFFKKPLKHAINLLLSYAKKKSFRRDQDFFFYGINNERDFLELFKDPNHLLVVGFSYCHKPLECPATRFSADCIHDPAHPVCGQCFIGKTINHLPKHHVIPLLIPTIHYIGEKIFEIIDQNPLKKVSFLITACEMTLEMFGDWGNMVNVKGIGVRLDGRICNTMKAFKLSEEGIKPGLTVVTEPTQERILHLISLLHPHNDTTSERV